MVRVKSEPRRMSPVTGRRFSNLVRAAMACSRLILINETDSRPAVNRILQDFSNMNDFWRSPDRYPLAARGAADKNCPLSQLALRPAPQSEPAVLLFLRRIVARYGISSARNERCEITVVGADGADAEALAITPTSRLTSGGRMICEKTKHGSFGFAPPQ